MAKSPQAVAQKWARNLGQSVESIRAGINAVTVSPTAEAVKAIDRYAAGTQRAVADGTLKRGLERVSLEEWREAAISKGLARIAAGAAQAEPKFESFMAEFLPVVENARKQLNNTRPRGDLEQNIARSSEMARMLSKFKRTR